MGVVGRGVIAAPSAPTPCLAVMRISTRRNLLVLVGSKRGLVSSGAVPAHACEQAEKRGARAWWVIDPRRTDTAGDAELFSGVEGSAPTPRCSAACWCNLADNGALDQDYIKDYTSGFEGCAGGAARKKHGGQCGRDRTLRPGLAEADVVAFFQMFRETPRVVHAVFAGASNQSAQGTDKVNAILNCHLATGRIGKPGASPFSLTGQPQRDGRPRGSVGLPTSSPPIWAFTPPDHRSRAAISGKRPRIATHEGLKAVAAVRGDSRAGKSKAFVGDRHQPGGVAAGRRRRAREALKKLELFVVSENVRSNDTVDVGSAMYCCRRRPGAKNPER